MPIIPDCIPPFEIKAPTTSGDDGTPTLSLLKDAERVFAFMSDERHLIAEKLYLDVKHRLDEWNKNQVGASLPKSHRNGKLGASLKKKQARQEHEQATHEVEQVQLLFKEREKLISRLLVRQTNSVEAMSRTRRSKE